MERPRADLVLPTARVEGVTRFEVDHGTSFRIELVNVPNAPDWFASDDPVLDIKESPDGLSADIVAARPGQSILQLAPIGRIVITVRRPKAAYIEWGQPTIGLKA